jgi:filamentous hemagglutinin family protein
MTQKWAFRYWSLKLAICSVIGGAIAISEYSALAQQVIPDTTLSTEQSTVTPDNIDGIATDRIDGGARRGVNLFHSFQEFNVDANKGVYFTSPVGIENILSRVTGINPSKIFGKLGVLTGNANLFLINPNGIIFGANASLNVGGSFMATTAKAIGFGEQGSFSTSIANLPSVLTVNPSALLFNQLAAQPIANDSIAPAGVNAIGAIVRGLRVPNGRSLVLVGGNINLNGGRVNALGGRVELGGLSGEGTVGLNVDSNNLALSFPSDIAKADVFLSNRARVDTSGEGGGNIEIHGKRVSLTNGSDILSTTRGAKSGGTLTVTASESLEVIGRNSRLLSATTSSGNAGDIKIDTRRLLIQGGANVSTESSGRQESLTQFIPATGEGGNLTVNASESVELINGFILSSTQGLGSAGNITINTHNLFVRDGAQVSASTSGQGNSGNIRINASSVDILGSGVLDINGSPTPLLSSLFANTTSKSTGNGGSVILETRQLNVRDSAEVSVSSEGTGDAGNINVEANSIQLENGGTLTAESKAGKGGGNITLKDLDLLLLHTNGEISTNARGEGNGGNINIDTDILAAIDKSSITAKAVRGRGGNIQIATQGLFVSPDSSINADSEQGINGVVEINRPDIDPSAELIILPAKIVDINKLIAQGCSTSPGNLARGTGEFVMTGRGGLPPNPAEATRSDTVIADLGRFMQSDENQASAAIANNNSISSNTNAESTTLVEASSWVIGSKGEVILTANTPTFTSDIPWLKPTSCNGS